MQTSSSTIYVARDRQSPLFQSRIATIQGTFWAVALMGCLFLVNIVQCSSLIFAPFSDWMVWKINRQCAQFWWTFIVWWMDRILKLEIEFSGDDVPFGETAFVIANHQQMPDVLLLMTLAIRKGRLGDMKWFVKDQLKYVPGIGWGLFFLGCIFLKRNWYADNERIQKTFARLKNLGVPFWMISFVEGTRITPRKLKQAQDFARAKGYRPPENTLIPKRKGFVNTLEGLSERLDAVYDVTIFYEGGIPTLWQFTKGFTRRVKLQVKRYPIASLPKGEEALSDWLRVRYEEKDVLLGRWSKESQ